MIPLTDLALPHFVPVASQDLDFQRHMSWSFCMLNDLMQDAFLCFVDICVIVDHYSLFLFILYHMIYVTGIRWRLYLYAACKNSTKSWFTVDNGGSNTGRLAGKAIYVN